MASTITLRQWLAQAPFGLAMSSGFFSFYAHTGMLASLTGAGFRPRSVSGSSAGALVGGLWAAGLEAEALANVLLSLKRDDFWDPGAGAGLLAGKKFDAVLRRILPVTEMSAARAPMAISVFDILKRQTSVLRSGDIALAVRASCAVPAMFQPVWIKRRPYWDGGIKDRPGLDGVPDGDRVLFHHIASRSPWRRADSAALAIPRRRNLVTLVIDELPRSGPFRLDAGQQALAAARQAMAAALDRPVVDGVVQVSAPSVA
jgi:NTE family protein